MNQNNERVEDTSFERIDDWNNWKANIRRAQSIDQFGKALGDNTIHKIDVTSTHPFNRERLKYWENGVDTDFATSTKTVDDPTKWVLTADPGDELTIESRQRMRYVPGYEILTGLAWYAENKLTAGQRIIVSLGNGTDAFRAVYTPEGVNDEYRLIRGGAEIKSEEFDNPVPVTQPQVDHTQSNMYGVGITELKKVFVRPPSNSDGNAIQKVKRVAQLYDTDNVVTNEFNLKMRITLDNTNGSEPRTLNAMSMQGQDYGNAEPLTRQKAFTEWGLGGSINDTSWTPILALRKDNDRESIIYNLTEVSIIPSARMQVIATAVGPDQTDATGFAAPNESSTENDATEITTNVTTPTDPSIGRQEGSVVGTSQNAAQSTKQTTRIKTPVFDDDVVVFMARTKTGTGASTDLTVKTEQEW